MANANCYSRWSCTELAVFASAVVGIIAAVLSFNAIITVAPAFLWVILGVAVVYLAVVLLVSAFSDVESRRCNGPALSALLTGILGTVLTSIILLAVPFAATSVLGTIIVGVALASFSLIITATVCFIRCLAGIHD